MKVAFFCDFDETITRVNVTDTVLERFADPQWLEIQEEWLAGKMTPREVLEKQMPLISVTAEKLDALIDSIDVDPYFPLFAASCFDRDHSIYILSDGFDYWIEKILGRALARANGAAKKIQLFSCGLRLEGKRPAISFPYFPGGCQHGCATCKPRLFERLKGQAEKTAVIGDGVSDFLLAENADLVFAKGRLLEFCRQKRLPCQPFNDFRDVLSFMERFSLSGQAIKNRRPLEDD